MFFENDNCLFKILEVIALNQKDIHIFNSGRNFNALSFRLHADTCLKTDTHSYHMKDNFVSYIPARLNYTRISKQDDLIVIHLDTINYHTDEIEFFVPKNPDVFSDLFKQILECWNKKEVGYTYKCASILYTILAECYAQNFKPKAKNERIQKSIDYISENYKSKDISIQAIARQSFMSEVYFRKLFKEEFGVSPKKYIIKLRIQNAIGLIATGYYTLSEVASMSGYNDYKHFSVEFKRNTGVSPSEYLYNYHP